MFVINDFFPNQDWLLYSCIAVINSIEYELQTLLWYDYIEKKLPWLQSALWSRHVYTIVVIQLGVSFHPRSTKGKGATSNKAMGVTIGSAKGATSGRTKGATIRRAKGVDTTIY